MGSEGFPGCIISFLLRTATYITTIKAIIFCTIHPSRSRRPGIGAKHFLRLKEMSQTRITSQSLTHEPTTIRQVLQVYKPHQTGATTSPGTSGWSIDTPWPDEATRRPDWTSSHNRIPPYREPSRNHRYFGRPAGRDWGEASFVVMMFTGVWLVGVRLLLFRRDPCLFRVCCLS